MSVVPTKSGVSAALAALNRRRHRRLLCEFVKLLVGLALLEVGPAIGAAIVCWAVALGGYWLPWRKCLAVLSALVVPLLLWT